MFLVHVGVAANVLAKMLSLDVAVPLLDLVGRDANTGVAATHVIVVMEMMMMMMMMMTTTMIPALPFCLAIRPTSAAIRTARIRASK